MKQQSLNHRMSQWLLKRRRKLGWLKAWSNLSFTLGIQRRSLRVFLKILWCQEVTHHNTILEQHEVRSLPSLKERSMIMVADNIKPRSTIKQNRASKACLRRKRLSSEIKWHPVMDQGSQWTQLARHKAKPKCSGSINNIAKSATPSSLDWHLHLIIVECVAVLAAKIVQTKGQWTWLKSNSSLVKRL